MDKKNVGVWVLQVALAGMFLMAGAFKLFAYDTGAAMPEPNWIDDVPEALVRTIGALEILGALGVVLPRATGIRPWLTPVAAAALALVMVLAIGFHVMRGEGAMVGFNVLLLALALGVVWGRWGDVRRVPASAA